HKSREGQQQHRLFHIVSFVFSNDCSRTAAGRMGSAVPAPRLCQAQAWARSRVVASPSSPARFDPPVKTSPVRARPARLPGSRPDRRAAVNPDVIVVLKFSEPLGGLRS